MSTRLRNIASIFSYMSDKHLLPEEQLFLSLITTSSEVVQL